MVKHRSSDEDSERPPAAPPPAAPLAPPAAPPDMRSQQTAIDTPPQDYGPGKLQCQRPGCGCLLGADGRCARCGV